jgi:hypothetical protein
VAVTGRRTRGMGWPREFVLVLVLVPFLVLYKVSIFLLRKRSM